MLVLLLSVFLIFRVLTVTSLKLCDTQDLVQSNVTSYKYKNESIQDCGCVLSTCFKKCCAFNFYAEKGICKYVPNVNFTLPIYRNETFLRHQTATKLQIGFLEHCNFTPLRNSFNPDEPFFLQENGKLWVPSEKRVFHRDDFCLDYIVGYDGSLELASFICIFELSPVNTEEVFQKISEKLNYVGMIISMPFLLCTFIAYALLPDRNLHMKALMSYVFNLLLGYILLVIIQLSPYQFDDGSCTALGYFCVFFFLVSFFWMNVICVDIFLGFRGFRGMHNFTTTENKRFYWYCLYAWGMSLLILIIVIIINSVGKDDKWYYPGVGDGQCFIRNGWPQFMYFYGPMGILIITNVALFTSTALKIRQVKKDTAVLKHHDSKRHSYDRDKQRFNLYLKLLLAMGVNWSMELISWAVILNASEAPKWVWYLTDFCNAIYGVFIFFIFVFKKNIWKQLKRSCCWNLPQRSQTMTTSTGRKNCDMDIKTY